MNTYSNLKRLPVFTALMGFAALVLRVLLNFFGQDARGLLNDGHILNIAVWAVTGFTAVLVCLIVSRLDGSLKYADNFSPSVSAAVGIFVLAAGIAVTLLTADTWTRLARIRNLAALLTIPALIWVGICRWRGRRPSFLFHALLCLYLTLHSVSHYQAWSSRPQLQDYFFAMAASILMTLFAYYQTAFDVGLGRRRMQLATGLLAAFFCIAALFGGGSAALYLTGAVWTLTNLCRLFPIPKTRKHPVEPPQETGHVSA
ncbi:MAG: hypothetical protein IJE81_05250 [Oscillospiraceae bacterium]|nr:hypothetical protein [Oscillospiraceae bacterium]